MKKYYPIKLVLQTVFGDKIAVCWKMGLQAQSNKFLSKNHDWACFVSIRAQEHGQLRKAIFCGRNVKTSGIASKNLDRKEHFDPGTFFVINLLSSYFSKVKVFHKKVPGVHYRMKYSVIAVLRMVPEIPSGNWLKVGFQNQSTKFSHEIRLRWRLLLLNNRAIEYGQLPWEIFQRNNFYCITNSAKI